MSKHLTRAERAALDRAEMDAKLKQPRDPRPAHPSGVSNPGNPVSESVGVLLRDQLAQEREAGAAVQAKLAETELALEKARSEGAGVFQVSAEQLHAYKYNPRVALSYQDAAFEELKAAIERVGGNTNPVKVRKIDGLPNSHYEILSGHRRTEACKALGIAVNAIVVQVSDADAIRLVEQENAATSPPSAYEHGKQYLALLRDKRYNDQKSLAKAIGVTDATISQRIAAADIGSLFEEHGIDCREMTSKAASKIAPWIAGHAKSKGSPQAAAAELFARAGKVREGDVTVNSLVVATKTKQAPAAVTNKGVEYKLKTSGKTMSISRPAKGITMLRIPADISDDVLRKIAELL